MPMMFAFALGLARKLDRIKYIGILVRLVEISSYPKSGNTWTRFLVKELFDSLLNSNAPPPISENKIKGNDLRSEVYPFKLPEKEELVGFYKSHHVNLVSAQPNSILYVYRHPLDVFLSSLNFLYNQSARFSESRRAEVFLNGVAKPVEKIVEDGEMDYYFDRFCMDLGTSFYRDMLAEKAGYFDHIEHALSLDHTTAITYESLIEDAESVIKASIGTMLEFDFSGVELDLNRVNDKTVNSPRTAFFWKAKTGTRFDFISEDQVKHFESIHNDRLGRIGY